MEKKKRGIEYYFGGADIAMVLDEGFEAMRKYIDECPECASYCDGSSTLLHTAAYNGTPEMIEYIVKAGGDVNREVKEVTPLCDAIGARKMDNVMKLIELGADLDSEKSVTSPVLEAILKSAEILKVLIAAGADITYQYKTKDNPWWDALTFAMYRQEDEAVEIIKEELKKRNIDFSQDEELFKRNLENLPDVSEEDVDYEVYVEENLGEIEQYYSHEDILEYFWGGVSQVDEDISVDVYGILPKGKDYGILITSGMSEYPMAETDEGLQYAEVMMKIPREWMEEESLLDDSDYSWTIEIMHKTACLGHMYEGAYVNQKVIVPYGEPDEAYPFDWDYEFTCVMLCESEDIPTLQADEDTEVKFYTLVPITEEEKELVYEKGSAAVKKMLSSGDVVDMERELLVEPEE